MNSKPSALTWRQLSNQLRQKILRGELAAGRKLPSTEEMARELSTNVNTMHRAMADLVREGLLTRTRKVGTFVTTHEPGLKRLGIYHAIDVSVSGELHLNRTLQAEIQRCAKKRNISVQVWSDPRPYAQQQNMLVSLEEAARSRTIQGLISMTFDSTHTRWLKSLPVPLTSFTNKLPIGVDLAYESFLEVALKSLKEQGCQSVALMVPPYQDGHYGPFDRFGAMAERQGMSPHEPWVTPWAVRPQDPLKQSAKEETDEPVGDDDCDYGWTGFEGFKKFWRERPHPDGLIVYPDGVARGVVMGLLTERVRIPDDLRVVLHKHEEMEYLCPLPVTYSLSRIREVAEEMIQQLDLALKGYEPHIAYIKFHNSAY